jgi:hypothetical protein
VVQKQPLFAVQGVYVCGPLQLTEFREPLKEWDALCQSAITAERFVRKQGLWEGCELELTPCFDPSVQAPKALQFRHPLLDFVKNESLKARPNERLFGSSEIIESVLGKTKRLEQDQSKSGFTGFGTKTGSITEFNLSGFASAHGWGIRRPFACDCIDAAVAERFPGSVLGGCHIGAAFCRRAAIRRAGA